jgi:exodeoxyribonuclease III
MLLATWNINSIRARQDRLLAWLAARAPDVVCLQETKVEDSGFPVEAIRGAGYEVVFHGARTYNGVAILSRTGATDVLKGFGDGGDDEQPRFLAARVAGIRVIDVYVPNGQSPGAPAYTFKLEWLARLRKWLDTHVAPDEPVLLCGDFNVAPEPRDVWSTDAMEGQIHFTLPEREAIEQVRAHGLVDLLRQHHQEAGLFSWWDYRQLSFPKGRGLRIDLMFGTPSLAARCTDCVIDRNERKGKGASDHAPVVATVT